MYHVVARGNARQTVFHKDADYKLFLDFLATVKLQCQFLLYAYCLMPNHIHLLIQVSQMPLSVIMKRLLGRYSWHYNFRRDRVGHVFQNRYLPIPCKRDSQFLELIRYIHLNPVRASLTTSPSDWPWSGHNGFLYGHDAGLLDVDFPLSLFHPEKRTSTLLYDKFVLAGIGMGHQEKFYELPAAPENGIKLFPEPSILDDNRASLEAICVEASAATSVPIDALRSRMRDASTVRARRQFIRAAANQGYRCSEIAGYIGCGQAAVSKVLCSRPN